MCARTVEVLRHRNFGHRLDALDKRIHVGADQLFAHLVDPARIFFERIVLVDSWSTSRILVMMSCVGVGTSKPASAEWSARSCLAIASGCASAQPSRLGEQHYFFYPDVAQESAAKRIVCFPVDLRFRVSAAQQVFELDWSC
jgi:hypothetical protein